MATSDIYRQMLQQTQPFGATAPFEQATDLEEKLRRVREQETAPSYSALPDTWFTGSSAPSPFLFRDASYNPTAGRVQANEKPQVTEDTTPDLGMSGAMGGGIDDRQLALEEGESVFEKGTEVSSEFIVNELSNIQRVNPDKDIYRRLVSENESSDGTHYRQYQYSKFSEKEGDKLGLIEAFNKNVEYDIDARPFGIEELKTPVYRHFLVKPDSKEGYSPSFEIAVKPEANGKNIANLEVKDFWFSDPTSVDLGVGRYMGTELSKDFPIKEKKWLIDTFRNAGKNLQEIQIGQGLFSWQIEDLPEAEKAEMEAKASGLQDKDDSGIFDVTGKEIVIDPDVRSKWEGTPDGTDLDKVTTDLDKVTDPKEMTLEEKRDERRRLLEQENFEAKPKKEVTEVQSAGGTFESVLKSIGIDTGPLGISQFDLPGFPEDLFNRDDYLIDVTTKERLPNNSFDRSQEAQYFQDQTGMRIDQKGEPEFFVIETTTQETNPEIEAALEAYALALRANTDLSGSVAQVISAQINATEGMGIGAERLTPQELANLKRNVSLISASEGILTAPGQFEEELARQRLREISTGQRGQASAQLANIYSNPVAYGMVTSTPEGEQFLKDLQAQATYDPFSEMGIPARQADITEQVAQQIDPLGPSYVPPAGGFVLGEDTEPYLDQGVVQQMDPNINLTSGVSNIPAPAYNPLPSARRYEQEMTDIEKGRAQAEAAKRGIYGEEQLRKAIQTVTPLGYDFGGSAKGRLAPKTRKRSTMPDPWAGSVQMAGY
jgi:hypothetical protein